MVDSFRFVYRFQLHEFIDCKNCSTSKETIIMQVISSCSLPSLVLFVVNDINTSDSTCEVYLNYKKCKKMVISFLTYVAARLNWIFAFSFLI